MTRRTLARCLALLALLTPTAGCITDCDFHPLLGLHFDVKIVNAGQIPIFNEDLGLTIAPSTTVLDYFDPSYSNSGSVLTFRFSITSSDASVKHLIANCTVTDEITLTTPKLSVVPTKDPGAATYHCLDGLK